MHTCILKNFGLSLGTGLSNQTLQSSNSPYTAGQTWNTIGGLPYRGRSLPWV